MRNFLGDNEFFSEAPVLLPLTLTLVRLTFQQRNRVGMEYISAGIKITVSVSFRRWISWRWHLY